MGRVVVTSSLFQLPFHPEESGLHGEDCSLYLASSCLYREVRLLSLTSICHSTNHKVMSEPIPL